MRVHVALFAGLRERAGTDRLELELEEGARVGEALERLLPWTGELPVVMAVNHEYADRDTALGPGDELALIPPVSGGSVSIAHARVRETALALVDLVALVSDPRAGATVTFTGSTRDVPELYYEAYVEMAERQMTALVEQAIARHGLCRAAAEHRVGIVPLSEPAVIVAASAPHRDAAFAGARELIDELKSRIPIWKREEGTWAVGTEPIAGDR